MGAAGKVRQPRDHLPGGRAPGEAGQETCLRLFDDDAARLWDRPCGGGPEACNSANLGVFSVGFELVFASSGAGDRSWGRFSIFSTALDHSYRRNNVSRRVLTSLGCASWWGPRDLQFC